jgi:hypothetical protein
MGLILRDENGMHFWREWTKIIRSQKFTKLVTIQAPMKNKYSFETRMEILASTPRVNGLFYSVERNADRKGYHIHLLINAFNTSIYQLAWALDIKQNNIPYYEEVDSQVRVSNYVTKQMNNDQIHYNYFTKKKKK